MEQGRYWMWSKPTHDLNFHLQASTKTFYGDSWEEQAFAVDAAGSLGGCIWPPRSYTCSFCRREFRSAQALGGHMNVHRRDRARLKQSPNPLDHEVHQNHQNHLLNPSTPLDLQCPSHISTMVSNSNPNCFRVFPSLTLENCNEKSSSPLFASSTLVERHNNSSIFPLPSRSNLLAESYLHILDLKNEEKNLKLLGYESTIAEEDFVKTDLSISLNFIVRRSRSASSEGNIEEDKNSKRQKIDSTSLSSFSRTNSGDRYDLQSEVLELSSSSTEVLDLELRLGDGQQVK